VEFSTLLKRLEDSGVATSLRGSLYYFPFLESVHVMALSVVLGTILVVDLRALGIASTHRSFTRLSAELLRITWGAFALATLSGALMFVTNARVYAHNTAFQMKLVLLALAGINMAVFHLTAGRTVAIWDRDARAPKVGRITAGASLALWLAIILAGRLIGFTTTGAQARQAQVPSIEFEAFLNGAGTPSSAPSSAPNDTLKSSQ
jgi:hypothetical protein